MGDGSLLDVFLQDLIRDGKECFRALLRGALSAIYLCGGDTMEFPVRPSLLWLRAAAAGRP